MRRITLEVKHDNFSLNLHLTNMGTNADVILFFFDPVLPPCGGLFPWYKRVGCVYHVDNYKSISEIPLLEFL